MAEITTILQQALFGIGTAQHDHVHRHNTLHLENLEIDKLRHEQENGGILPRTLNDIAMNSGQLCAQPQGFVSVEDGMNQRRGICLLKFQIYSNAAEASDMSVVCYLVGGNSSAENGLDGATRLQPVRCWSTLTSQTNDSNGYPAVRQVVDTTHQFLLGDPYGAKEMAAVRPYDVASAALGYAVTDGDGSVQNYCGVANSDLTNQLLMSKTQNLNPTHYSKELLKLAVQTGDEVSHNGQDLAWAIGDYMTASSLNEISPHDNPFMQTMMSVLSVHSLAQFRGWSVDEMVEVWPNFLDVLNLDNMDVTRFAVDDTTLTTSDYGRAKQDEIIASEAAMMCVHQLLAAGLMSYKFSATNNPTEFDGVTGDEGGGVSFSPGQAMSVLDNDTNMEGRVETFNRQFTDAFYAKYTGPYAHLRTLINLSMECHMFGETRVTISFGGEYHNAKTFSNATYYINHSSSSISGTETGLTESRNYLHNIKEYF